MTSTTILQSMDDGTRASGVSEERQTDAAKGASSDDVAPNGHKRSPSGGLSKLSFLRASAEDNQIQADNGPPSPEPVANGQPTSPKKPGRAMAVAVQQLKTRRRKGSLRKAALLGRGAQREKKELEIPSLITRAAADIDGDNVSSPISPEDLKQNRGFNLGALDTSSYSSIDHNTNNGVQNPYSPMPILAPVPIDPTAPNLKTSPTLSYTSTTDDDDVLSFPKHLLSPPMNNIPLYFPTEGPGALFRRRSTKKPNSPLPHGGSTAVALTSSEDDWDYADTEWWGWVVLIVTWVVFVIGMGSCLGVWSWAWDVGETPYAPPELEDDPTLPIVGYYPALIILTAVMAWVWVVVAWVGMKYFRHAKISGD
ncbi:hypothetical protein VC83_01404 [Pseudogymnoascus destructans]|nr:uncharacterized protein VC83_01404 [Pseudogymnoascus destructans]OAF61884.1 hypothetical protein VC83_01404 [Pseudogymnoascus destructans]